MKADGGALIYIILAVVVAIVNAVAKSKKKEIPPISSKPSPVDTQEPKQAPQTTWQKELEDIFGKVLTEPEVVVDKPRYEEPKPVVKPEIKIESQPSNVDEWNKYAASKKIGSSEPRTTETVNPIHVTEDEHELATVNMEEFDLTKAVIYAEVLNRKYF